MSDFQIHPRLLADCHQLGRFALCLLLLHKNAGVPWFILVPEVEQADLLDLPPAMREQVLDECALVADYLKQRLQVPKVNLAQLGNQVPQMHLHLIGRRPDDACWPLPIWGNLPEGQLYRPEDLRQTAADFAASGLRVG